MNPISSPAGLELHRISPNLRTMMAESRRSAQLTSATEAINLAIGEPDLEPPAQVISEMRRALSAGYTHYADFAGDPELRHAIADVWSDMTDQGFTEANVQITPGATAALSSVILSLVSPGDTVVVLDPSYSLYSDLIRLAGGEPVLVPTDSNHHLDIEALRQALPGARAFIYCNPVNPTGAVFRREELEQLALLLHGTDTIVLEDPAYSAITYGETIWTSALNVPGLAHRTVVCQTFSKAFAMTGFRIGYALAPVGLIEKISTFHRTFNGAVNSAAQRAALAALRLDGSFINHVRGVYANRSQLVTTLLDDIPQLSIQEPEGAFYAFPRILTGHDSATVATLLESAGVRVRSGREFGPEGEQHLRISFAASEPDIEAGIHRIAGVLESL